MSRADLVFWIALPYVATAVFIVGHIWRWRHDQFGWTSRSSQLYERTLLMYGSNLFHYGALLAIAGHILGILIPAEMTAAVGIDEHNYHLFSAIGGGIASVMVVAGLGILIYRRVTVGRVRAATSFTDLLTYTLLAIVIGLGVWDTAAVNLLGGGYDYRTSVSIWFRGIYTFSPHPELMAGAPLAYQLHASVAWLLYMLWPFSRLVHVWSYPIAYLFRPYIVYRRQVAVTRR